MGLGQRPTEQRDEEAAEVLDVRQLGSVLYGCHGDGVLGVEQPPDGEVSLPGEGGVRV